MKDPGKGDRVRLVGQTYRQLLEPVGACGEIVKTDHSEVYGRFYDVQWDNGTRLSIWPKKGDRIAFESEAWPREREHQVAVPIGVDEMLRDLLGESA